MYWDGRAWATPQAPPAPKKKGGGGGTKLLAVIGVLAVLFALGKCGSSNSNNASTSSSTRNSSSAFASSGVSTPAKPSTPTAAPAGSAVRDGKFEFQVLSMTRAKQAGDLSNQFEIVDAQGEFIIVNLSVANIGNEAQSYFGTNQKLIDTSGRKYGAMLEICGSAREGAYLPG